MNKKPKTNKTSTAKYVALVWSVELNKCVVIPEVLTEDQRDLLEISFKAIRLWPTFMEIPNEA